MPQSGASEPRSKLRSHLSLSVQNIDAMVLFTYFHAPGRDQTMRKKAPLDRAAQKPNQLLANMHRWKFSVLAAAAVASAGFYAGDASALALGRITVQSALGEPLRAEIDLPQITPAEADTLRATTATPEVFRAQGMEYTPAINNLQIQLQRRPDGTAVLRLTSDRPVNDPFLDLVLDANWGSGRIVRSYTMLFDPPALRRAAPNVTASPQISAPAAPSAPAVRAPVAPRATESSAATVPPAPRPAAAAPRPTPADGGKVQAGGSAGRLANAYRPASVSLDQMLVAMMRANPDAFIQGNVNRLKAGAVLQMPDEVAAQATPAPEARQILAAQAKDFNEFRRKLAGAAPTTAVAAAERSASGTGQPRVEDKNPATTAPDKLTLSKGSVKGQKAAEDQLAKDKQASEAATRMAELSKNITDLNKLGAASAAAGSAAPAGGASAPAGVAVQAPAVPATPTAPAAPETPASAPVPPASAPADVAVPAEAASEPASAPAPVASAPAAPARMPAPAPAPVEEPSFLSGLMDDPILPLAGGGLLALLLGYGAYRVVQRRRQNAGVDSSFLESRIQPDSFFGASGGQRVDTANSEMTTGSSMAYSPSQLDAGGDVDPVAEADVYLAYGRDLQAEEILKEALRSTPDRLAIRTKMLEVYAKRRDTKGFEQLASQLYSLTQGKGEDWARIQELGLGIDPENPLYQPGGQPAEAPLSVEQPSDGLGASTIPHSVMPAPSILDSVAPAVPENFAPSSDGVDLDLDISAPVPLDEVNDSVAPPVTPAGDLPPRELPECGAKLPSAPTPAPADAPLEFGVDLPSLEPTPVQSADAEGLDFGVEAAPAPAPAPAFDLGDISLDLDTPAAAAPAAELDPVGELSADPMARKLELADEFRQIGGDDRRRELLQEVVEQAQDAGLKARAQSMLDSLS